MSFFADLLQQLLPGTSGVERLAAVFTAALAALSDVRMWRSLGWMVIGVAMMGLGIYLLARQALPSASKLVSEAA